MRKILLTAIFRSSLYIASIIALTFLYTVSALAKNNCDTNASTINPAILAHSGIGGTGTTQSGIGGTGLHSGGTGGTGNPEGGMGGTGNVANDGGIGGTGIIGIVTGFASICVNGVEIHYDNNTPVSVDGKLSTVRDLAVGQVIAVRALGTGQALTAQSIAVIHAVVGPIGSFNPEAKEMRILGQSVQVDSSKDHSNFSNLKTGDWVQVSGHRLSSGTIVASRIEPTPLRAEARLNGHVTQIDTQGFEINGTRIHYDAKLPATGITQGMEVQVAGHWDGANLKAQHIQTEPTRQSIGNVERVVIEGYVHAVTGKELNVGNRIVALDPNTQLAGDARNDLKLDQRIQISGRFDANQRINAERIELTHESPVQIQERIDRNQTDGDSKDKKNSSDNELDPRSTSGSGKDQSHGSGDSNRGEGSLKKEAKEVDVNSSKDHSSGDNSHSKNSSGSTKDEQKTDVKPASSDGTNQSHGSGGNNGDKGDLNNEANINSDKENSSGREQAEKPQDIRESNSSDYQSIDKPERPVDSGSSDRSADHRDSLRDIDIPDRVRDHVGHHDRHIDR